ncbi:hypothetical protein SALB1_0245 [Salinisphaera sp. LB1]|nr:hypothetical protein SALB1_0245 [Salinisphaera sp. LB1]
MHEIEQIAMTADNRFHTPRPRALMGLATAAARTVDADCYLL